MTGPIPDNRVAHVDLTLRNAAGVPLVDINYEVEPDSFDHHIHGGHDIDAEWFPPPDVVTAFLPPYVVTITMRARQFTVRRAVAD